MSLDVHGAARVLIMNADGTAVTHATAGQTNMAGSTSVAIASDQSAIPVSQSGTWSLAANQSTNVAQINGVTPLMGAGNTGTGSPRVTIASDNAPVAVTRTPAGRTQFRCTFSGTSTADMTCSPAGPSGASNYYYITDIWLGSQSAQTVSVVDSATSGCGSGTTTLVPATYFAANGQGGMNFTTPISTGATNTYLCLVPGTGGASNTVTGVISGYIAP